MARDRCAGVRRNVIGLGDSVSVTLHRTLRAPQRFRLVCQHPRLQVFPGPFVPQGAAIVATGAGNIVATGAGNIGAIGAGNYFAAGGGIVATGAGNVLASVGDSHATLTNRGGQILVGGGNIVSSGAGN